VPSGRSLLIASGAKVLQYDLQSGAFMRELASGNGLELAYGLAQGPDGTLYVADFSARAVLLFAADSGTFIRSFNVGSGPYDLAFGPDGKLYIGVSGGNVLRFDPSDGTSTGAFVPGPASGVDFGGLRFHGDSLFISYLGSQNGVLQRYDATTGAFVAEVYAGFTGNGPRAPTVGPDGALYVPNWQSPNVAKFAATTYGFVTNIVSDPAASPISIAIGPDGNLIVLSDDLSSTSVRRYDSATGKFLGTLVPAGRGGLGRATRLLVLQDPRSM
jgi:DNA-binding beta-propeller fold protein YncE